MKRFYLLILWLGLSYFGFSQNVANRVLEYKPAPGQHINIEQIGTPQAAEIMPDDLNNLVSLGAFGGYLVMGFEKACVNDPENPYGIDFTIFGNAFSGSSEPGVIWVMKDSNKNGEPDETWYEIKGSQHSQKETKKNYGITYFKSESRDILWKDNLGETGMLKANSYNEQEYYPLPLFFNQYSQDSITFTGTLLKPAIDSSNPQQFKVESFDFGYADVHPRNQGVEITIPDNPYTEVVEGAGGDPVDISWAVDSVGNYVNPDSIHFVKIVTGNLANMDWLGEVSTDVAYVADVDANPDLTGEKEILVLYHHKPKLLVGDSLNLEANYFQNGRLLESTFDFSSQNASVASVNSLGIVTANNTGETEISIHSNGKIKTTQITVVEPDSIEILSDFSSVYAGDTILLEANVFDNLGEKITAEVEFNLETQNLGIIIERNGESYFVAENSGQVVIGFQVEGFIEKPVAFQIWSENDLIDIYFTVKTETENLLPLQSIQVPLSDINDIVENRQNDYSNVDHFSLAHALSEGLQKAGLNTKFRDDENSNGKLYLYSIENDGDFTYGWGGKSEPQAFAKAWIARVNNKQYLNNFDKIEIADGDTVVLYSVLDLTNTWIFTRIISATDSANVNDEIEIFLEQTLCSFIEGNITESGFSPIVNQEIVAEQIYYSDNSGAASILVESQPPLIISSGNDAVLISKKIITGISNLVSSEFQVFPNPFKNEIYIKGNNLVGKQLSVFEITGKCIWTETVNSSQKIIDLHYFDSGIYLLRIIGDTNSETFKLIKK